MNAIIAAAGTGGHINPGIAIANKIKEENTNAQITFIGTVRGLENDLVPRAGYKLETIEAYGINRKISIENIRNLVKTLKSIGRAKKIIKKLKPDVVIGTGGYICMPVMLAAKKLKIPTLLHESNAFPGVSIKVLSKDVNTVMVGFEDAIKRLPKAKNVVLTGTPTKMKKNTLDGEKINKIKEQLGFKSDLPVVLVTGGSQGAKSINETLINIIKKKMNTNYQIIWAAGKNQYDLIKEELQSSNINIGNIPGVKIVPYIYNMEEVMNAVDVVVARSGAMTITEISILGKPAIFIPYPYATENHQEYNAKVLEKTGAAKIILDKNLNDKILSEYIEDMIKDKDKLKEMSNNARKIAIDNVEERIYKEILKVL